MARDTEADQAARLFEILVEMAASSGRVERLSRAAVREALGGVSDYTMTAAFSSLSGYGCIERLEHISPAGLTPKVRLTGKPFPATVAGRQVAPARPGKAEHIIGDLAPRAPLSITALVLGDPAPGRSALDRKRAEARGC